MDLCSASPQIVEKLVEVPMLIEKIVEKIVEVEVCARDWLESCVPWGGRRQEAGGRKLG